MYAVQQLSGAPEEIRTPDPQIRSLVLLCEVEHLRMHKLFCQLIVDKKWANAFGLLMWPC